MPSRKSPTFRQDRCWLVEASVVDWCSFCLAYDRDDDVCVNVMMCVVWCSFLPSRPVCAPLPQLACLAEGAKYARIAVKR